MRSLFLATTLLSLTAALALAPARAYACGGTFCDGASPTPMTAPVNQTGETVVFVLEPGMVEAHIQIEYDPNTDAAKFAWIVPVFGVPELEVGSQQLFVEMLTATVPTYGWMQRFDTCPTCDFGSDGGTGDGGGVSASTTAGTSSTSGTTTDTGGVDVLLEETVGAFDAVVVDAQSAADLMTWLADNGYFQDPAAEPILQQYVDEGAQFAAFRLTQGADVGEIHPVVIRYAGDEPCIPLRLTRIAAEDDMAVRAFFLGDERAVPTNWRHVVVNPLAINWMLYAANWSDLVSFAVDTPQADGHAWVTEYAGTSDLVQTGALWSAAWNPDAFTDLAPELVVDTLQTQGLAYCFPGMCQFNHPLVLGLLRQWLPAPVDVPEQEFYGCLSCYLDQIDLAAWDGPAFAQALQERIVVPGAHAVDVVDSHPYLTRLFTTISPAEMTEDPLFGTNPTLGDVDDMTQIATRNMRCDGSEDIDLPDGSHVELPMPGLYPQIEGMPAALVVEELPESGAPVVLVDNAMLAADLLADWNDAIPDWMPPDPCGADSSAGLDDGDGGKGCGCSTEHVTLAGLLVLPVLLLRRRRR